MSKSNLNSKQGRLINSDNPMVMELEAGTYYWCRCGRSKNQPFCDGAHSETDIQPLEFQITEKKRYAMCLCKITGDEPFCDGKHKLLKSRPKTKES